MCASLDSLSKTLEVLKTVEPDKITEDSVKENINHVDGAMRELDDELKKVQGEKSELEARRAMRRHLRRAFYPFNEDTLKKIKQVVDGAIQNLNLALQVLQVRNILAIQREVHSLTKKLETYSTGYRQKTSGYSKRICVIRDIPELGNGSLNTRTSSELGQLETNYMSAGVGKTVLTSAVVEFLEGDLSTQGIGLAFIYCNHKEQLSQTIGYFVGAIIRQLVERMQVIPEDVHTLYKKHCGKGTGPTSTEYLDLLRSLTNRYSEVYIVIDALDECIDKDGQPMWGGLLTKLKNLVSNLRLLCTSRHIDYTSGILAESTAIEIRATDADIETYVQEQLLFKNDLLQFCEKDPTLKNNILQAIKTKAEGM
ncbi:hypothetical protein GP486_007004 [Trichoglossum hirsutum]|uniref:Nephrocystin 3-like N-terminal domain-containing protein n=1 Tax=Trichoglossum hirsutum TaxID=265104 RepID=A0A9P8ICK1_9PEZI|nr:hypothetical protein GP486_007004 [Trichoglossum hirsutum]